MGARHRSWLGGVGRGAFCGYMPGQLHLPVNGLATDLDTEHGAIDANKRDAARQLGRLNVADLDL